MSLLFDPMKFWLVAARLTGFFMISPGMNEMSIPRPAKAAFLIWLTVLFIPILPSGTYGVPGGWDSLFILSGEVFVGMAIGLVSRLILAAIQFGGAVIDSEIGLLVGQQLNPFNPFSGSVFSQILLIAGLFYFWSLDYFSILIMAVHESFELVPIASAIHSLHNIEILLKLGAAIFSSGLMIASPVIAVMFFVTITIGLLSRAVQSLNIFAESFVIKVLFGILAVLLFLPLILMMVRDQLERIIPGVTMMLKNSLGGSSP